MSEATEALVRELRQMTRRIKAAQFKTAEILVRQLRDAAYAQGVEDGREIGRAEGLEEGIMAARDGA